MKEHLQKKSAVVLGMLSVLIALHGAVNPLIVSSPSGIS